jgi:hypothetical protein
METKLVCALINHKFFLLSDAPLDENTIWELRERVESLLVSRQTIGEINDVLRSEFPKLERVSVRKASRKLRNPIPQVVYLPTDFEVSRSHDLTTSTKSGKIFNFPRLWTMFSFILPRKVRNEVFEPALEELKEDFLVARKLRSTRGQRRWLTICFTVRTIILVAQSIRAWLGDRTVRMLKGIAIAAMGDGAVRVICDLFK